MKKVHIINHTHWDREWYFSTMDSLVLSDSIFSEVLEELEMNENALFTLDGQISIVNEYLQLHPEKKETIIALAKSKRLSLGPWYTQSDAQLLDGESIIRNLAIGVKETRNLANEMRIAYLPDTFGFHAQMPTILQNCGIDHFVFWRGIDYSKVKSPYFIWRGLGDKQVLSANLINGYGSIPRLYKDAVFLQQKVFAQEDKIRAKTNQDEIAIPIGNDQNKITNDMKDKLSYINQYRDSEYISSNYEQFFEYLKSQEDTLQTYNGEMRCPSVGRVHKTIGSVRMDIKQKNYALEQMLLKRVEPLLCMADSLGIKVAKELAFIAWKKVMEGQAHDGLAGCINDSVAADVMYRFKQAQELCEGLENLIKKRIADNLSLDDQKVMLFHLQPNTFHGYKEITILTRDKNVGLEGCEACVILEVKEIAAKNNVLVEGKNENYYIDEAPYYEVKLKVKVTLAPFSYQVFDIKKMSVEKVLSQTDLRIQNNKYHIFVEDEKLVLKYDDFTIDNFIYFEDCGNDGDTYDFSPLREDKPIQFSIVEGSVKSCAIHEQLCLHTSICLPATLDDRLSRETMKTFNMQLMITLEANNAHPRIDVKVDNNVESHRLRMVVNSGIMANASFASIPFGFIERKIGFDETQNWQDDYLECPIDIEVMDDSVSVHSDKRACTIFSKGIKEYQVQKEKIYLTLFSTTAQLGKSDLLYRPGRASGDTTKQGHVMIPTPHAQLLHSMHFSFMVAFNSEIDENTITTLANEFTQPSVYYQSQSFNKFVHRIDNKIQSIPNAQVMDVKYSLFAIEGHFISSIMPSLYDEHAYVVRITNPTNALKKLDITNLYEKFDVQFINGLEERVEAKSHIEKYDFVQIKIIRKALL